MSVTPLDLNRIDKKESTTMYTDLMIQQIHAAHVDSQRRHDMLRHEQMRLARLSRPSFMTLVSHRIGTMLITAGQRLRQEHVLYTQAHLERMNSARTA